MTRPAVTLSEAMTQDQLERLILLASNLDLHYGNVSWGGPWAGHAMCKTIIITNLDRNKVSSSSIKTPDNIYVLS
jgi:hypothetical protein